MVIEVNKETFDEEVLHAPGFVLVDFWGPQCQPCLALMPHVEGMASDLKDHLKVTKIDASKNRRLCLSLKVLSLPTFVIFKDGKEVGRLSGNAISPSALSRWIAEHTMPHERK